jgi:Tubulin like
MRPVIFIGCGGSGMSTLRSIHDLLSVSLQEVGAGSKIPDAFQFIVIDVPNRPQVNLPERIKYIPLAGPLTTWLGPGGVDPGLARHANRERREDYQEWRTDPVGMAPQFEEGAGQFRALGRAVGTREINEIGTVFAQRAQTAITGSAALASIAERFGFDATRDAVGAPMVIVVSSLGGGAGSGIFLDVCEIVRVKSQGALAGLQQNLVSVLYDPSVFERNGISLQDGGIPGNSYAAVMELVASNVHPHAVSPHLAAGNPDIGQFNGPQYTFMVGVPGGAKAEGITSTAGIYKSTARTIAAWVLNPTITKGFGAWLGNWDQKSVQGAQGLFHESANGNPVRMPTSAFGYARLDLGRTRLQRYIIENAVRSGISSLVNKHKDVDPDAPMVDDQIVSSYIQSNMHLVFNFLKAAGLNENSVVESNENNDDILEGLRTPDLDSRLGDIADQICRDFSNYRALVNLESNLSAEVVSTQISAIKGIHQQRVLEWAKEVQVRYAWALVDQLAIHGIRVLEKILESSQELLKETFPTQLIAEKDSGFLQSLKSEWDNRGRSDAFKPQNKAISQQHRNKIRELVKKRLQWQVERDLRDIAQELCQDVARSLIQPARGELRRVREDLEGLAQSEEFRLLSDLTGPADQLLPTANEILIESVVGWKPTMERLLRESSTDLNRLSLDFITCAYYERALLEREENSHLRPWTSSQEWIPKIGMDLGLRSQQSLSLRMEMSLDSVMERAYGYFMRSDANQTPLASYCRQTILGYLQEPGISDSDRTGRVTKFCEDLRTAMEKSEPLVEINWERVSRYYSKDKDDALHKIISEIPLKSPSTDEISARVKGVLADYNLINDDLFSSESKNTFIEIFSSCAPMPPSNFLSLSGSIVRARNESESKRDSVALDSFFRARRSRPYDQFLPYASAVRMTAARGWIVGLLTGRIDLPVSESVDVYGERVQTKRIDDPIYVTTHTGGRKKLLFRPVGQFVESHSKFREVALLTSVLNSGLMAEMMSIVQADAEEFEAFQEVIRLGFGHQPFAEDEYNTGEGTSGPLVEWLRERGGGDRAATTDLIRGTASDLANLAKELREGRANWFHLQAQSEQFEACPHDFLVAEIYSRAAIQVASFLNSLIKP